MADWVVWSGSFNPSRLPPSLPVTFEALLTQLIISNKGKKKTNKANNAVQPVKELEDKSRTWDKF